MKPSGDVVAIYSRPKCSRTVGIVQTMPDAPIHMSGTVEKYYYFQIGRVTTTAVNISEKPNQVHIQRRGIRLGQ